AVRAARRRRGDRDRALPARRDAALPPAPHPRLDRRRRRAASRRGARSRRRGRHAGPPDPQGDALSVPGLDDLLAADGWPYASAPPTDPDDPGRFHALFGRDSLITALQVLPERPDVARATLRALARLQGTTDDPVWDEEPGKIVHEVREAPPAGTTRFLGLDWPEGGLRYYGSADATSWFLYLLAATGDAALADDLRGARERAGDWLLDALERGGGLVRWGPRAAARGRAREPGCGR